jgi:hypothetical protein
MTVFKPRLLPAVAGKRTDSDTVKTTVELPGDLWRAAKIRAMDERTDLRSVLIRALEQYLGLGQSQGAPPSVKTGSEDR